MNPRFSVVQVNTTLQDTSCFKQKMESLKSFLFQVSWLLSFAKKFLTYRWLVQQFFIPRNKISRNIIQYYIDWNYVIRLLKINTSGLRRREIRRRSARKPYCPTDEIFVSSVTIYEAAPILFLLLFGMIFSLIIFGIEHVVFRKTNPKQTSAVSENNRDKMLSIHKSKISLGKKNNLLNKKSNLLSKGKGPPKNNVILVLPHASTLFQKVVMSDRYQ